MRLRENQKVIDSLLTFTDPKSPTQILIAEEDCNKVVKFKPNAVKNYIPQYELFDLTA